MDMVQTVEDVEALLGTPSRLVMAKASTVLDEGCRAVLAAAPLAALGMRDALGVPRTAVLGGVAGFAQVELATRLTVPLPPGTPRPVGDVSMLFLMPGVRETLRLNGTSADAGGERVAIELDEAFVHCARCVLRSRLWDGTGVHAAPPVPTDGTGPLAEPEISRFLAAAPFALVSSWDGDGHGDTSPRGDLPGFLQVLDGHTLAVPDRRGNKRADTMRNLISCPDITFAVLVPGRSEVLHLRGTAAVTTDPALLATMALQGKAPHAALTVCVEEAALEPAPALHAAWDGRGTPDAPDMNAVGARHLAANEATGTAARVLVRALGGGAGRRALDAALRKAVRDEGY